MFDAVHQHADDCDVFVMCAAVADYKPAKFRGVENQKALRNFSLELVPTRDILASLAESRIANFFVVGFAAETDHVEANAQKKLREKNCDIIVANDVSDRSEWKATKMSC